MGESLSVAQFIAEWRGTGGSELVISLGLTLDLLMMVRGPEFPTRTLVGM